jgi:hypothetical protein
MRTVASTVEILVAYEYQKSVRSQKSVNSHPKQVLADKNNEVRDSGLPTERVWSAVPARVRDSRLPLES